MDKTAIKNFSIWARNKLIADITYKAGLLGITEEGIKDALPQSTQDAEFYDIGTKEPYAIHGEEIKQRKELVSAIRKKASQLEYKEAYRNVIEEVAYTWFNRLIAIRFMEVNDYMPAHIRVLSSEGGKKLEPDLVTTPFDAEIEFTQQETENILQMKNDNQVDALFRFLFIKQCNTLNAYLPKLFEKTSDYTELLLNVSVTDQDGIVYHLTHDIKEDDFNISNIGEDGKPTGQVEIIGWMYQYYNTEPKAEAFALLNSNIKISKERIPAATQIFTPDWIVRYMVENSVGRLWLEGHENEELKKGWKYYLDEAEQEADVEGQLKAILEEYKNIKPEEIKVIDPCMGSGHILVYAFDVLMQIYENYGYSQRDAAKSIVENNIYGLDIDDRAFQLAYFAIMMKARSYNRRFLTLGIEPNLCAIQESNGIQYDKEMGDFLLSEEHRATLQYLLHTFVDAKEYGSILNIEKRDYDGFLKAWEQAAEQTTENVVMLLWYNECNQIVPSLVKQATILTNKYDVTITNPPYMGSNGMNDKLARYVQRYYSFEKADMFACCIKKGFDLTKQHGLVSVITMESWMFLSSFEKMRSELLDGKTIINMVHMPYIGKGGTSLGINFGTSAVVIFNEHIVDYQAKYNYLRYYEADKEGVPFSFPIMNERNSIKKSEKYSLIPGQPIAYWLDDKIYDVYSNSMLNKYVDCKSGIMTGSDKYVKMWYEVDYSTIKFDCKSADDMGEYHWFPLNSGGDFRYYYGNNSKIVDLWNDGFNIRMNVKNYRLRDKEYYFRGGITWGRITSSKIAFREVAPGSLFGDAGPIGFVDQHRRYILGFLCSKVALYFLEATNPTLNYQVRDIENLPLIIDDEKEQKIEKLVSECVEIEKKDWDDMETSWEFLQNNIVRRAKEKNNGSIQEIYNDLVIQKEYEYNKLKSNEEEINQIFINMYGLQSELSPEVEERDVTIEKMELQKTIKRLISYAVGCIFGRYSSDSEKVVFAGGNFDSCSYGSFNPNEDNIILITDEEYLKDDIVGAFCEWVKYVFGEQKFEDNIEFIASVISGRGNTAKEKIRSYFMTEFYKDHCSQYSIAGTGKRPIYWLFDSGKQNGFKALVYMHRYNADTIGNLRVDYLHRMERIYESEINRMQDTIDNSGNAREVTTASKRKEKLQKQLKECQEYDEKIGHLALSRIEIDLNDGVKANYEKVQTANDGKKYRVLAKI